MRAKGNFKDVAFLRMVMCCFLIWWVAFGVMTPKLSEASDLNTCMAESISKVDDSMTIGELRLQCAKQLHDETYKVADSETDVVSERLRLDKEHVLQPFTLMAHRPNYLLVGAYNSAGYDSTIYQRAYDNPSLTADDTEAQFQLSIKFPLLVDFYNTADIYAAYTNRSFWQVYNSDISAPFRETNHEPEIWVQFQPDWEFLGFKNTANSFGFNHQSNGQGGILSRSWNRIYANFVFERGDFALSIKPWYRIPESDDDDDNSDITDYLGNYEIRAAYKWNEHVFSVMSRNNLQSGFENGAIEASWSFPLGDYPYLKGYLHYFTGYGESLIDYNHYVNTIGIGISLTDWL